MCLFVQPRRPLQQYEWFQLEIRNEELRGQVEALQEQVTELEGGAEVMESQEEEEEEVPLIIANDFQEIDRLQARVDEIMNRLDEIEQEMEVIDVDAIASETEESTERATETVDNPVVISSDDEL
jgi:predicted nuclease with TOPRIM domain